MKHLIYALILYFILVNVFVLFSGNNTELKASVFGSAVAFFPRALFMTANESLNFFEPKLASDSSLWVYDIIQSGGVQAVLTDSFFVQTIINYPAFYLVGASRTTYLLTNCFVGALSALAVFFVLNKIYALRTALTGFILISFYPSVFLWSIFGLRDIIIFFFVLAVLLSTLYVYKVSGSNIFPWLTMLLSFLCIFSLRPELLVVVLLVPASLIYKLVSDRSKFAKYFRFILKSAALLVLLLSLTIGYYYGVSDFGYRSFVSPDEIVSSYVNERLMRASDPGDGSTLLSSQSIRSPFYLRAPVQITGMFLIPLPHLITDFNQLVTFVVSIVLICIVYRLAVRIHKYSAMGYDTFFAKYSLFVFFFGMMAMGVIIVNAGNAFRLRTSILPLVLVPFAVTRSEM